MPEQENIFHSLRKELGISQECLSDLSGVNLETLQEIETATSIAFARGSGKTSPIVKILVALSDIQRKEEQMTAQVIPQHITDFRQRLKSDRETTAKEIKAYELLIQGNEILAELADQRGPGQATMYRIKIDGYKKSADQCRRELAKLDEILS